MSAEEINEHVIRLRIASGAYDERAPDPDDQYAPSYEAEVARYEQKCAAWRRDVEAVYCPAGASPRLRDMIWVRAQRNTPTQSPHYQRLVFIDAYKDAVDYVRAIVKETGGTL